MSEASSHGRRRALRGAMTGVVAFALAGLAIDLLVATAGYLATGPLFGKEIRSVDQR